MPSQESRKLGLSYSLNSQSLVLVKKDPDIFSGTSHFPFGEWAKNRKEPRFNGIWKIIEIKHYIP